MAEAADNSDYMVPPPMADQDKPRTHDKVRREDDCNPGSFDHPVYKLISMKNGEINKMSRKQMKETLASFHLDTNGVKEVLKKRLKNYYKQQKLAIAQVRAPVTPQYDYYVVIDFEATCEEAGGDDYKHEIIEFPVVLVDAYERRVVDEFHAYVKPTFHPRLSSFCTTLTGITQEQVDQSATFPDVLQQVEAWMDQRGLGGDKSFAVITDGPWDMSRFMCIQCRLSQLPFPKWAKKWINLRKSYCNFYRFKKAKLVIMLESLGMTFEGQQHSGIDDSRNIARISLRLLEDGCDLKINERLFPEKDPDRWVLQGGEIVNMGKGDCDSDDGGSDSGTDINNSAATRGRNSQREVLYVDSCTADMARLSVNNDRTSTDNQIPQGEIDDLLSYYALQNS